MSKRKGIKGFDANQIPWTPIILLVGGIYVFKQLGGALFSFLPGQSAADKELQDAKQQQNFTDSQKNDAAASANVWNPNWYGSTEGGKYKSFHGLTTLGLSQIPILHDEIFGWDISFSRIFSLFKQFAYQTQISQLSSEYFKKYGQDLYIDLRKHLYENQLAQLNDYVTKLPTGKI